jgi:hypothetical protein
MDRLGERGTWHEIFSQNEKRTAEVESVLYTSNYIHVNKYLYDTL